MLQLFWRWLIMTGEGRHVFFPPAGGGSEFLMMSSIHRKIIFADAPWKPFFFADLYCFGNGETAPKPLIYYIGGAGNSRRYEDRVNTEPETLLSDCMQAAASSSCGAFDLIISPAPLTTPEQRETRLDDFLAFFLNTLVPEAIGPLPPALGFIGSSYGSFFASYLSFRLAQCRSLGLISGMGMIEACEKAGSAAEGHPAIICYSNIDDETGSWTDEFAELMRGRGVNLPVVRKPGERRFDDYRANGAIRDAFSHVLRHVQGGGDR